MFGALQQLLHPTHCYALCAVARSGAHLLSSGLRATHLAGRPLQYFHEQLAHKYAARHGLDAARQFTGLRARTWSGDRHFQLRFWFPPRRLGSGKIRRPAAGVRGVRSGGRGRDRDSAHGVSAAPLHPTDARGQTAAGHLESARDANRSLGGCAGQRRCGRGKVRSGPDPPLPGILAHAEQTWAGFFQRNGIEPLAITYEDLCCDYPATVGGCSIFCTSGRRAAFR